MMKATPHVLYSTFFSVRGKVVYDATKGRERTVEPANDWPGYVKRVLNHGLFKFHNLVAKLEIALVRLSAQATVCVLYVFISAQRQPSQTTFATHSRPKGTSRNKSELVAYCCLVSALKRCLFQTCL